MDPLAQLNSIPYLGPLIPYITAAVAIASVISTVLPPPSPTSPAAYQALYRAINSVALAFGHATNATDPKLTTPKETPHA